MVGWFTGAASPVSSDGLFVPSSPIRMLDTRWSHSIAPWGGSVIEFGAGDDLAGLAGRVAAAAMNIAVTEPLAMGAFGVGTALRLTDQLALTGELRLRGHEWRFVGTTAEIAAGISWRLPQF